MSSIPYSGGTIVNTTFSATTRAAIVTGMENALTTAGWSVISGGGTGDVLMKSAVTPASASNSIRMRLYDPGSGNCAQITMKNDAGSLVSQIFYLLPGASTTYRIIACKYNFFVFTPGSTVAREFLCGGTLYIPSFLEGVLTADLGFIWGNASSDSSTTIIDTPRTKLGASSNPCRFSGIINSALTDVTSGIEEWQPKLYQRCPHIWNDGAGYDYAWHDGSLVVEEALLGWGLTSINNPPNIRGIIHNCMIIGVSMAADDVSISSYDSHAWFAITGSNSGTNAQYARGTLFVTIT